MGLFFEWMMVMKKKNIINLIRCYAEHNDSGFKAEAYEIAKDFDTNGDYQLAEYIMALMSDANTFVPQMKEIESKYLNKVSVPNEMLLLPDAITQDILGIVNAVTRNIGINKFLLKGAPGTGKTEAAKQLARILKRDIYLVDFSAIIDSKLGQTQKNIVALFKEINAIEQPEHVLILFDEIDALALDRTNQNDLREMGRATSALLKALDYMQENIVLVATTNLYDHFDKAVLRRFDYVVDFNRYTSDDLIMIAERLLDDYLANFKLANRDIRLVRKIMGLFAHIPYPGDLKNMIKTAVAFSDPKDGRDYFRRLYTTVTGEVPNDLKKLQEQKFTLREIEILTSKSKSSIDRELKAM